MVTSTRRSLTLRIFFTEDGSSEASRLLTALPLEMTLAQVCV